ncbi:MAG: aminoglycoside phosphotransferase family protein, partial [Ilumatobacteraceae bacterium]
DDEENARKLGWEPNDVFARVRIVADSYGLPPGRAEFVSTIAGGIARGGEFVRRRVEAGDPNFITMWNELGGMERFDRRRRWFTANADRLAAALG